MQDDIIGALTQEIKEEVIERYLYDRRLIEEQIKYVDELAEQVTKLKEGCASRFVSIYELLVRQEFITDFAEALGLKDAPFRESGDGGPNDSGRQCWVKVRGLTPRAKFKKLLSQLYLELYALNSQYKGAYEDLREECKAVNYNLKKFQNNYDLLTILNFLKDMDVEFVERKRWLGDNFSPEEMASIEANLSFKPIRMEQFKLDPPPILPEPKTISKQLNALANCVYGQCADRVKKLIQ
jgi:hypothetical protein